MMEKDTTTKSIETATKLTKNITTPNNDKWDQQHQILTDNQHHYPFVRQELFVVATVVVTAMIKYFAPPT